MRRLVVPFRASAYWTDRDRIAPHAQTPEGSATCLFATLYPFPRRLGGTADYGNEWRLENTCLALPRCIALAIRLTPRPSPQPGASTPRYLRRAGGSEPDCRREVRERAGQDKEIPRKLLVYISDDGDILGIRYDNFKFVFLEQRCKGTMEVWGEPFTR